MLTPAQKATIVTKKDYRNIFSVCKSTASKMYCEDVWRWDVNVITVSLIQSHYKFTDNDILSLVFGVKIL